MLCLCVYHNKFCNEWYAINKLCMNVLSLETNSPSDFFTTISISNKTAMQTSKLKWLLMQGHDIFMAWYFFS